MKNQHQPSSFYIFDYQSLDELFTDFIDIQTHFEYLIEKNPEAEIEIETEIKIGKDNYLLQITVWKKS